MTLRVGKLVYGIIKLLPCLLAVLLASSCSSDVNSDEQKGNKTLVTLTIAASGNAATASRAVSGNSSTITRADVSDSGDKDYYISDLTVLIFDERGNVIGSTTKPASDLSPSSDGKITIQVLTRAAQNCTVYAIANALALNGSKTPFAGIATLSALTSMVKKYANADDINTETCLLMMGKTADKSFDTTNSGSAAAISLQRLASRIDFNITVNDDQTTGFPIVVDSYQLCNVPNATFYTHDDMANPTLPADNTYQDFSEQNKAPVNSWENPTVSYVQYVYANPVTAETNATYLLIKAHAQASSGNTAKIWESVFKVYLKEVKQGGALMTTQYQILPNYHYTVNITIKGSKVTTDNGVVCTAYPFFSTGSLQGWTSDEKDIDFKYEGN